MVNAAVTITVFISSLDAIPASLLRPIEGMICLTDQISQCGDRRGEGGHSDTHSQILIGLRALVGNTSIGYTFSHPLCDLKGFFPPGID
jgi:hypothetical protein